MTRYHITTGHCDQDLLQIYKHFFISAVARGDCTHPPVTPRPHHLPFNTHVSCSLLCDVVDPGDLPSSWLVVKNMQANPLNLHYLQIILFIVINVVQSFKHMFGLEPLILRIMAWPLTLLCEVSVL